MLFKYNKIFYIFLLYLYIEGTNDFVYNLYTSFTLNKRSRRNYMLTMGTCFRSFKNILTMKYIIHFKEKLVLLKKPTAEYDFINEEYWNIFVKNRLSGELQVHM